jgi:ATP-dependent Zn protease
LIIPSSLRERLQSYVKILHEYEAYTARGVHLPKGLLFHGPPGCGKTQIAKTLSAEAALNFVALSTTDCKAMFIGWSADRLAKVFAEARAKQPSLIFIDELDAVCPIRGTFCDSMSQEFTAQLLQEIDGLFSDSQAIFLVGATNRSDQVDAAILSRFSEQIEIPLPDATARRALLELFLRPLPFDGDKTRVVRRLASESAGKSGRDLRGLVNQAVLSAVKRCSSPRTFSLGESDFCVSGINGAPTPALKPQLAQEFSPLLERASADAMSALVTLGYNKRIAMELVNAIPVTDTSTTEEILRAALRGVSGHVSTN